MGFVLLLSLSWLIMAVALFQKVKHLNRSLPALSRTEDDTICKACGRARRRIGLGSWPIKFH